MCQVQNGPRLLVRSKFYPLVASDVLSVQVQELLGAAATVQAGQGVVLGLAVVVQVLLLGEGRGHRHEETKSDEKFHFSRPRNLHSLRARVGVTRFRGNSPPILYLDNLFRMKDFCRANVRVRPADGERV